MSDTDSAQLRSTIESQKAQLDQLTQRISDMERSTQKLKEQNQKLENILPYLQVQADKIAAQSNSKIQYQNFIDGIQASNDETNSQLLQQDLDDRLVTANFGYYCEQKVRSEEPVYIMGEFNQWQPELMERVTDNIFAFETKVLPGYKYRFNFRIGENLRHDLIQDKEKDENEQDVNFKYILENSSDISNQDELIQIPLFVHPLLKQKREEQLKLILSQFTELQATIVQFESSELSNFEDLDESTQREKLNQALIRNRSLLAQLNLQKKVKGFAESCGQNQILQSSLEQIIIFEKESTILINLIQTLTRGKFAKSLEENPIYYYFCSYNVQNNEILLKRVFDNNGILLDESSQIEVNRKLISTETIVESYQILFGQEAKEFKQDMLNNEVHTFKLKYTTTVKYVHSWQEKELVPISSQPEVNFADYTFSAWSSGYPYSITNKIHGAVKSEAVRVDQLSKSNHVTVYTNEISSNVLNIIHINVEVANDQIILEFLYANQDQDIKDFQDFKSDENAKTAQYKIIIKDQRIFAILYSNGSGSVEQLQFFEFRISKGMLASVSTCCRLNYSQEEMFVQVENVPIGHLVSLDKNAIEELGQSKPQHELFGFCTDGYFLKDLKGYIDVNVISLDECNNFLENQDKIALPVCLITDPSWNAQSKYVQKMQIESWTQSSMAISRLY
ncbi:UNKNOWN [Stylonychia lemnae]|uniref:AMP-activated protein kinase glycogen-binding domain-containing protein n=1 Tax=Stylonychia lemnae TaxID=5949 RepID=A0A078AC78_STYLE|nr:UNKNOWN [Stylonychia lemnae]|eukprot:CDW79446.1 UNKNOWN [Stylonychia lemnae]